VNFGDRIASMAPTALAVAAAWSCYSTLGLGYTVFLACLCSGAWHLQRTRGWGTTWRGAGYRAFAALWLLLLVSALWSPAPRGAIVAHLWTYSLVLLMPISAAAWTPAAARKALRHFIAASAMVGALNAIQYVGMLPDFDLWRRIVDAQGNQRIAVSLLLALGAVLGLVEALDSEPARRGRRVAWIGAALLCTAGLAAQDRRSGMLILPLLLIVLVFARERSVLRRVTLVAAIVLLGFAAWQVADGVRARFAEGFSELLAPRKATTVSTSWGQRLSMVEITAGMVAERPLLGHGVASWRLLWEERTPVGSALREHTTPHNEYLLVASQVGAVGLFLLLVGLAAVWRLAWNSGPTGTAALLAWTLLATSSLFNAMLRDAKFSLPLLTLAALAGIAGRSGSPPAR